MGSDGPGQVDGIVEQGPAGQGRQDRAASEAPEVSEGPDDPAKREAAARARAVDLLEATHQFPCDYSFTVIAFNRAVVTEAIKRVASLGAEAGAEDEAGESGDGGYQARASREGKYLSHRFAVRVNHAGEVLELYARLRSVDGVVTLL